MNETITALLVSGCLGALIGLFRQWGVQHRQESELNEPGEFSGLRTFSLQAILGAVAALLSETHGPAIFVVAFGLVGLIHAIPQIKEPPRQHGTTTYIVLLLTFLIGGLVVWQETQTAVVATGVAVLLVALKQPIHEWTQKFTVADIRATLQFIAVTGVILPLVPNKAYGPFEAFNPYSIWMMVVLISGLGFLGYVLMRLLGTRAGVALTGLLGGLASSTATTLAFSRRSKEDPEQSAAYALAIILACTVMPLRVVVILATLNRPLASATAAALLCLTVPGLIIGAWKWLQLRRSASQTSADQLAAPALTNPLSLKTAIRFALIYAAINFVVRAASAMEITQGLLGISFISGLTDMDATVLSMSDATREDSVTLRLGGQAIMVAGIANTLLKGGLAVALGARPLRTLVAWAMVATMAGGIAGFFLVC